MQHLASRKGFTLIELLIVVTIIGLLASVVLVGLAPAQRRGRDARRLSDIKETQNALELYYNKCRHYPGAADQGAGDCTAVTPAAGELSWDTLTAILTGGGIGVNQIPKDPTSAGKYYYAISDGGTTYVLAAKLEQATAKQGLTAMPSGVTTPTGVDCASTDFYCTSI